MELSHSGDATELEGYFKVNKPLDEETQFIIRGLRHGMSQKRDSQLLADYLGMSLEECLIKYGVDGQLYVKDNNVAVICHKGYIKQQITYQPWIGSFIPRFSWKYFPEEQAIRWDRSEKFYCYVEWIQYLIDYVLAPRGYVLNGHVETFNDADNGADQRDSYDEEDFARAADNDLYGYIDIEDNVVDATHPIFNG